MLTCSDHDRASIASCSRVDHSHRTPSDHVGGQVYPRSDLAGEHDAGHDEDTEWDVDEGEHHSVAICGEVQVGWNTVSDHTFGMLAERRWSCCRTWRLTGCSGPMS
jgi:hypothetical protein